MTRAVLRSALIAAWAEGSLADPSGALILAHDRHEVETLNRMARDSLDSAGLLGPTRMIASGREWAAGDRLVCRRNDYRLGVRNGTRGTVVEVDREARALRVLTDDGVAVRLSAAYLENVYHGYAITGHISQGATVERTFLLATPERGGAEWAYVASTRQRVDLTVFVVHHEPEHLEAALARSWERSDAKHLAFDLAQDDARRRAFASAKPNSRVDPSDSCRDSRSFGMLASALGPRRDVERGRTRGRGARGPGASEQLRLLESSVAGWIGCSGIARPRAQVGLGVRDSPG